MGEVEMRGWASLAGKAKQDKYRGSFTAIYE
jgi:hypothetical protein